MNLVQFPSSNYSQSSWLKYVTLATIKIIILLFIIYIILINYRTVLPLPTSSSTRLKSDSNRTSIELPTKKATKSIFPNKISSISKFRCTGDENNIEAWSERLCVFNNICYNVQQKRFEYYRRLRSPKFPLFYDSYRGMLTDFSSKFVSLTTRGGESWAPSIVEETCPTKDVTWLTNLHTLWREYFGDNNFGHLVWEDIGSIYYSLERMNLYDEQLMIMHYGPVSTDSGFKKYLDDIFTVLTSNPMLDYKPYLESFKTNYVCFHQLMVGGNLRLIHHTVMKENHGREALLYKWRSDIIKYHKYDPEYVPNQHRFLITNKSTSIFAKAPSGIHRAIANLQELVVFVKKTYPHIPVDVIEWHKIPLNKQIELLLKTTILITPSGGVSMIAPFLPHGSHAIITDYYANGPLLGFTTGASASMEGMLLNHFPHFKKDYYQIYGPKDYVFDFPGTSDTRNDASIVVNMTRLHLLIESAIEDMNL